jgi:succinate-acetate transporter protein
MLKNMTVKQAVTSKEMLGGAVMIVAGIWFMATGQETGGLALVGFGMKVVGARDKAEGQ